MRSPSGSIPSERPTRAVRTCRVTSRGRDGVSATVIGRHVRVGTTGRVDGDVRLTPGTPQALGLWAYLAKLTGVNYQPFGSNPHTGLVLT